MFPHLIDIGSFFIPSYGTLVSLGVIIALFVIERLARQQGLNSDHVWNLSLLLIFAGIVGAKLLYIFVNWHYYMQNPGEILSLATLRAGGVFSGGVVLAVIAGTWYIRKHHLPWLRTADVMAPGLALGHAFGRIGCFAAGCCYGKETHAPWAVTFHNPLAAEIVGTPLNIPLHPTQLYEMIVEFANFALLFWLIKNKKFEGQVMGTYLFLYGVARFCLEFLRGDPGRGQLFGTWLTDTQFLALCMIVGGGIMWMRRMPLRQPEPLAVASKA